MVVEIPQEGDDAPRDSKSPIWDQYVYSQGPGNGHGKGAMRSHSILNMKCVSQSHSAIDFDTRLILASDRQITSHHHHNAMYNTGTTVRQLHNGRHSETICRRWINHPPN